MVSFIKKIALVACVAMIAQQTTAMQKFNVFKKSTRMFSKKTFSNQSSNFAKFKNIIKTPKKSFGALKIKSMKFKTPLLLTTALITTAYINISKMSDDAPETNATETIVNNEQASEQDETLKMFENAHKRAYKKSLQITREEFKEKPLPTDNDIQKTLKLNFVRQTMKEIDNYRNYIMQREFHKCAGANLGSFNPKIPYLELCDEIFFSPCVKEGFDSWNYGSSMSDEEVQTWLKNEFHKYGLTQEEFENIARELAEETRN